VTQLKIQIYLMEHYVFKMLTSKNNKMHFLTKLQTLCLQNLHRTFILFDLEIKLSFIFLSGDSQQLRLLLCYDLRGLIKCF
jgi:hypothetical protein